jgi:hypothetical protein
MALPPSSLGAVQLTRAALDPPMAVTPVGAAGPVMAVGTTAAEAADAGPDPLGFEACTVKVYDAPGVSPETLALVVGGPPLIVVVVWATPALKGVIT